MKKIILSLGFLAMIGTNLPYNYACKTEAGIIKWGIKKLISGSIHIIFSKAKDSVIERSKDRPILHLRKHPEYIEYASTLIKKQIDKHPKYSARGNKILQDITMATKQKLYYNDTKQNKELKTDEKIR